MRQYRDFIFFERAEPPRFLFEAEFDFARSEDKDATSEAKIRQLAVAYLDKAHRIGAKEELIRAYLTERHSQWERRIEQQLAEGYDTPREQLLGVFDVLGEWYAEPGFRGCAMVNASAAELREERLWVGVSAQRGRQIRHPGDASGSRRPGGRRGRARGVGRRSVATRT